MKFVGVKLSAVDTYINSIRFGFEKVAARAYCEAVRTGTTVRPFTWMRVDPRRAAQIRRRIRACLFHDYVENAARVWRGL